MVIPRADSSSSRILTAGEYLSVSRHDHGPFQILPELAS